VTTFNNMFIVATDFNNGGSSDINNWSLNTSTPVNMYAMFTSAINFNQPLNLWNTSAVTNMSSMFSNTTSFNQNIGSWNISNVTNFYLFMQGKTPATFSSSNLDAIYNGWGSRVVKPSLSIHFGTVKYTSASATARAILSGAPNNWSINDGGLTA